MNYRRRRLLRWLLPVGGVLWAICLFVWGISRWSNRVDNKGRPASNELVQRVFSGQQHRWRQQPELHIPTVAVDYTVPFDDYKEHKGLLWLLNHFKVVGAKGVVSWDNARDYLGYYPTDRSHPKRIADADLSKIQFLYVTDTYGVYRDDLKSIETHRSHMDYSPVVFGGLSRQDADVLERAVQRGVNVVLEFNAFCDPTISTVRRKLEQLWGVNWTGWVGRVLVNPHDVNDVPHWLPRIFEAQYPGKKLPEDPMLVFVHRNGKLVYLVGDTLSDIAPKVILTPDGKQRFAQLPHEPPYYYWFSLMQPTPRAKVWAELQLPESDEAKAIYLKHGLPLATPLMTEFIEPKPLRIYFSGDFSDVDFDLGAYDRADAIGENAAAARRMGDAVSSAPAYWNFFAPVMREIFQSLNKQKTTNPK